MGDVERNIEQVRRLEAAYNARDYATVDEVLAEGFTAHTAGSEMLPPGKEGPKAANEGAYRSFPDKRTEILDIFGEGDLVVSRVRSTGTNTGGLPQFGIPANDAKTDFEWIQISRHDAEGRIAETWAQMEIPKLMQQLGAMPGPGGM